ncbi:hypothetical protein Bca52824_058261 [Brassica carinata]|uniref:Uncharacterized protein n=1 Tax=Brassica carinata TaxID=52824 RepID=A0A8X7UH00_BRACI|nr:hypothetical protein Bca52824_058261 [Brassica carinata]
MALEESFAACLAERTGKSRVFNILFMGSPTRKSGIEYTLKKLLQLTTNEEAFDALKTKTVDLVLTAHSTQFVPNTVIRIRDGLAQLYAKDTALIDKQELDEDLQHKVAFRTDEIQRTPPAQQDEMRAALSYYHETTWK